MAKAIPHEEKFKGFIKMCQAQEETVLIASLCVIGDTVSEVSQNLALLTAFNKELLIADKAISLKFKIQTPPKKQFISARTNEDLK